MKKQTPKVGGSEVSPRARTNNLVIRELPDEELVYDLQTHKAYCLNQTAATIWKQCDGQQTIEDIALRLQQETKTSFSDTVVKAALYQLDKANLLEQCADFSADNPRQLRREILRRIGLGVALPLVVSIIVPSSAQAMSCGDPNNNTNQNAVGCSCQSNNDCSNNCCGFGPICADLGLVTNGNSCRVNCECASGLTCKGSPQRCLP